MSQPELTAAQLQSLYQYALVLCQQPADASDLLQHGVETYLLKISRQQVIHNPEAYVRTVVRNRFYDQYRRDRRQAHIAYEEQAAYDISPVNLEQLCIQQDELQRIWSQLAVEDRDILYHWAILGLSTDEACAELGIPRGTFLSRMHRLKKHCQARRASDDQRGGGV